MKWAVLVGRSTITQIASCPSWEQGNPVTKSMVTQSHFHSGISKGQSSPAGFWCSALTIWHVRHFFTNIATSDFIPDQKYCRFRSWYIFVLPGCMANLERWASCKIAPLNTGSAATTSRPLKRRNPSALNCHPSSCSPRWIWFQICCNSSSCHWLCFTCSTVDGTAITL